MANHYNHKATFSASATSAAVDIEQDTLVGIMWDAGLAGTTITVHHAPELGGTYRALTDTDNSDITVTVDSAAGGCSISPIKTVAARFIKLVSSASETANITLVTREV